LKRDHITERPGLGPFVTGALVLLFYLTVGGVGVATWGFAFAVPMVPLATHLLLRGGRSLIYDYLRKPGQKAPPMYEVTRLGGITLGVVLVVLGAAPTVVWNIGIPIFLFGLGLIVMNLFFRARLAAFFRALGLLRG